MSYKVSLERRDMIKKEKQRGEQRDGGEGSSSLSPQGARSVLAYHDNSIAKALRDLYPELQWDTSLKITCM